MPRLPIPGGDSGNWGQILNDYLSQAHNTDGSIKNNAIIESNLAPAVQTKLNAVAGQQGATGATGAAGPQGPAGSQGATGSQGSAGTQGATGPQGIQGTPGLAGPAGSTGPIGPSGSTGATGPQGSPGTPGAAGSDGATGPQGPAGTNGTQGSTGPQGATGPAGTNGTTGATGPAGATTIGGITGLQNELDSKRNTLDALIQINGADNYLEDVRITNDGSVNSTWPDRLVFRYRDSVGGTYYRTGYFNEYGEIRVAPARANTVPFRVFTREYTTQPARNMTVPVIEVMDDRDTRTQLFAVMPSGKVVAPNIGNKVTTSDTPPTSPAVGDVWIDTSA